MKENTKIRRCDNGWHFARTANNITLAQRLFGCNAWTGKRTMQMASRIIRHYGMAHYNDH